MATKSIARDAAQPVSLADIKTVLNQLDNLTKQFVEQYPAAVRGQAFLSDASFVKAQNTHTYLVNHPNLFAGLDRDDMADGIRNFLDFQALQKDMMLPLERVESIRKYQSQRLHQYVLNVYDAAKSSVKTGISGDPKLARPLMEDLSGLFEKSIETRRKNKAKKMEQQKQQNGAAV